MILADHVPSELVTIASRCVRVTFRPLSVEAIATALAADGVPPETAATVAVASAGRLDRARLLAADQGFAARAAAWRGAPSRLDGTGATIAALADELLASIDTLLEPLRISHAVEQAELEEREKVFGERGSGRKALEDRQKREERRLVTDEFRAGLTSVASHYRDRLADGRGTAGALDALAALRDVNEALAHNPSWTLLLQGLLVRLSEAERATV